MSLPLLLGSLPGLPTWPARPSACRLKDLALRMDLGATLKPRDCLSSRRLGPRASFRPEPDLHAPPFSPLFPLCGWTQHFLPPLPHTPTSALTSKPAALTDSLSALPFLRALLIWFLSKVSKVQGGLTWEYAQDFSHILRFGPPERRPSSRAPKGEQSEPHFLPAVTAAVDTPSPKCASLQQAGSLQPGVFAPFPPFAISR